MYSLNVRTSASDALGRLVRSMGASKLLPLFALGLLAPFSWADSFQIKPGLWEHSMQMESETGQLEQAWAQMKRQMEAMPEAQRQMMLDMMEQQGVSLDFGDQTVRNCVTEEQAARGEFDWSEDDDCRQTDVTSSGSETRVSFECDDESGGSGELVVHSDTEYSGQSRMTMDFEGQTDEVRITHQGRWVSDDCGNVRP